MPLKRLPSQTTIGFVFPWFEVSRRLRRYALPGKTLLSRRMMMDLSNGTCLRYTPFQDGALRRRNLLAILLTVLCIAPWTAVADDTSNPARLYRGADVLEADNDITIQLVASQQIDPSGQRHLTYNGGFPGPQIHVNPGGTLNAVVYNGLEHLTVEDLDTFNPPVVGRNDTDAVQEFISAQSAITNLHTHGFHVSPKGRSDNVLLRINQRRHNRYTYFLPEDHAPGTHWYHAHLHGSTAIQVQGGMAGALIVDAPPGQSLNPPGYAVHERVLVLQFGNGGALDPAPEDAAAKTSALAAPGLSEAGQRLIDAETPQELRRLLSHLDGNDLDELVTSLKEMRLDLPTPRVNGIERPLAKVQQDIQVQRLRIVNTGSRRADYKDIWIEGHPMYLAAFDGVNLTSLPKDANGQYVAYTEENPLELAPGNRADVFFLPSEEGTYDLKMKGEIGLEDLVGSDELVAKDLHRQVARQPIERTLMRFEVSGPDLSAKALKSAGVSVDLERFLNDLNANLERLQTTEPYSTGYLRQFTSAPEIQRDIRFSIENSGTQDRSFRINDRDYNELVDGHMRGHDDYLGKVEGDGGLGPHDEKPWPLRSGTEEHWKITNTSTVRHPFHIHVSPFWVLDIEEDDGDGNIVSVRDTNPHDPRLNRWQDTIDLPPNGGSVTVDHRVSDFDGVYVVHCHILQHEDRGMMINVMTVPNQEQDPVAYFQTLMEENERINEEINGEVSHH